MTGPAPASTPARPAAPEGAPASAPGEAAPAAADTAPATGSADAISAARARIAEGKPLVDDAARVAAADSERPPEGAGVTPAAGEEPAPGSEAGEEADGETGADYMVTLEPLEERGEEPIKLEAPDEETFNRLNRLTNDAKYGRDMKTQIKSQQGEIDRAQEELSQVEDQIRIDPVGFVVQNMPVEHRPMMALQLLMEPTILAAVQEHLAQRAEKMGDTQTATIEDLLQDPASLRLLQQELRADRGELRDRLRTQTEERRTLRASATKIRAEVDRLIPPDITGQRRDLLFRDSIRDIRERCDRLGIKDLKPEEVRLLVRDRFSAYGVTPQAGDGTAPGGTTPKGGAPPKGRTAEELKAASDSRRAAAAAAPAGAGAPAAKPGLELPATTDDAIKQMRAKGLRRVLNRS